MYYVQYVTCQRFALEEQNNTVVKLEAFDV